MESGLMQMQMSASVIRLLKDGFKRVRTVKVDGV
jgi:hypothetical protein